MYLPQWVPVGQDQLPHLELAREIARRFNHLYGGVFPEPEARLTPAAKCPGLDGRKMSKSYNNGIFLRDSMDSAAQKIKGMFTDKNRLRKSDPGNPDICNLFPYHVLMASQEQQAEIREGCTQATLGCVECKAMFLKNLANLLEPLQTRRAFLDHNPDIVSSIIQEGNIQARKVSAKTMNLVRKKMGL